MKDSWEINSTEYSICISDILIFVYFSYYTLTIQAQMILSLCCIYYLFLLRHLNELIQSIQNIERSSWIPCPNHKRKKELSSIDDIFWVSRILRNKRNQSKQRYCRPQTAGVSCSHWVPFWMGGWVPWGQSPGHLNLDWPG